LDFGLGRGGGDEVFLANAWKLEEEEDYFNTNECEDLHCLQNPPFHCDLCDPILLNQTRPSTAVTFLKFGLPNEKVHTGLEDWRRRTQWPWFGKHGKELLTELRGMSIPHIPSPKPAKRRHGVDMTSANEGDGDMNYKDEERSKQSSNRSNDYKTPREICHS
jgi:hypothetical protein